MRNTPLDFSVVPVQQPDRYERASSNTNPRDAARSAKPLKNVRPQLCSQQTSPTTFTPPRYDGEFFQAMAKLDADPA